MRDEQHTPQGGVDEERRRLAAALAWALRHLPDHPPDAELAGWSHPRVEDYEQNREAAHAILLGAVMDDALAHAPNTVPRLPDPADLVLFVAVDVPRPSAGSVPMASGSTTPLHARQLIPGVKLPCPPDCKATGQHVHRGPPQGTRCAAGCPACAARLPDPIPDPNVPRVPPVVAAPAGSPERAAQLERTGVAIGIDSRVLPRDAAAARAELAAGPVACANCFGSDHTDDDCPWLGDPRSRR